MCAMPEQEPGVAPRARPDASMSLLTTVMDNTLDEGYAQAAARRREAGRSELPRTARAKLWLAGGLVLAGLVVTLGAAQAREAAPTVAREREELLERVHDGTRQLDDLQARVDALRSDVDARQRVALSDEDAERAELVALLAGASAVEGPGVKLVVDDAEDVAGTAGGPRDDGFAQTGRVRDRDLQRVVNGLWQAGAEAVTVNDQRLTALSAIRAAGDAVLVDNRPLVPPYTVLALGDPDGLLEAFDATLAGHYLTTLRDDYGIRVERSTENGLRLPAAPSLTTRSARPLPPEPDAGTLSHPEDPEEVTAP
ncbi:Uncharacterized conserved protein YlxW, UPF0749 family [Streptomyces zhaozhouensis]|uniref:Uncharacterized conserved protein YlxW, UPF0749 family n=1 Tax=Streptomyces zhaozhouensis TaxID=1300267 RepID=A0A286DZI1_9ACTN|nr:DUF881 domain-containing protein [Streptomyces zhaozhouensis]SOD64061.1 Uncharacterized conserved protein YlxW, UPF0749 family [Streptomyces zhaozhouensis]